jgi:hypothetical protein
LPTPPSRLPTTSRPRRSPWCADGTSPPSDESPSPGAARRADARPPATRATPTPTARPGCHPRSGPEHVSWGNPFPSAGQVIDGCANVSG